MPGCLSGLGPCVSATFFSPSSSLCEGDNWCRAGASCACRWRRCPKFHSSLAWNGTSCDAKRQRDYTAANKARASEGSQAVPPLASPSPPPVQCTIPNPLAFFLIPVLLTGRKGGDLYRHAHRVFEGRPGLQRADPAPSPSLLRSPSGRKMKVMLIFPPDWFPSEPYLSLPSLTAVLRQAGHHGHPERHQSRDVGLVLQRGLSEEGPAPGAAAARPPPQARQEA